MPHFQIKLLTGRTEEQKQKLTSELIRAAQSVIGLDDESYSVAIQEYTWDEWKEKVYPEEITNQKYTLYKKPGYSM